MSFNLQLKIIGAPLKFNALLYDIIYTYILNTDDNLIKIKNDPSFSSIIKVQDYIDNNTGRTIKVESLAKLSGYTPSYFIELFKKNMNMTPLQYIHKRKLQEAERMILFTDYSVRRISDMLGFCNQNKFSEFFKKQTGYSPLQFKKINAL
jgi:AraC-like DNA-binding protein